MDAMSLEEQEQEIQQRVGDMTPEHREHLRTLIYEFVRCYDPSSSERAVVIMGDDERVHNVVTINCDSMEAANLMLKANDFFGYLHTRGAPPKEMFN